MEPARIVIDAAAEAGALPHFWRGTGFTPADNLLRPDYLQLLTWFGSIPHQGIEHVRIHSLLNLVAARGLEGDHPEYDWSQLEQGIDALRQRGLRPFFELMGNPSGFFSDFNDPGQLRAWRRLVGDLARRLFGRYGPEEVRRWWFETWNEPDCPTWWKQFDDDPPAFCRYFDACRAGLDDVDPALRLGGPGGCQHLSPTVRAFLAHCDRGASLFTGRPPRLDFISTHEKGAHASPEHIDPDSAGMLDRERRYLDHLRREHPRLASLPFMNNEGDPQVGWGHTHSWHATSYYPAFVARVLADRLALIEQGVRYELFINDNGFIGTWGQRSLLACYGDAEQRAAGRIELIKKPIFNLMAMLGLLGDTRLATEGGDDEPRVIASSRGGQIAVLLSHGADRVAASGTRDVELDLRGLSGRLAALSHWTIAEGLGDPFALAPHLRPYRDLERDDYALLRSHQELAMAHEPREVVVRDRRVVVPLRMPMHSVSLVVVSPLDMPAPTQVGVPTATAIDGLPQRRRVLLTWPTLESRTLRGYEVLASTGGAFERVNRADVLGGAYVDTPGGATTYRVRAVDYLGRRGPASAPVSVE